MSEQSGGTREESTAVVPGETAAVAPAMVGAATAPGFMSRAREFLRGDLGSLPVVVALIIIFIYFQIVTGIFLSPRNLSELVGAYITTGTIALGAVMVLLIGEIDLSMAVVATLCGAVMGLLSERAGWSAPAAIVGGLLVGVVVGLVNGFFVAVMRMPSFIVTLAGLIGYQGLIERLLSPQQTLPIHNDAINQIAQTYLCPGFDPTTSCSDPLNLSITLPVAGLLIYLAAQIWRRRARAKVGLPNDPFNQFALRFGLTALIVLAAVALFVYYRGVPLPAMILVGLIVLFWLITQFTAYGRHIYAVGGNAEAARRAGIRVVGLRVSIFVLCSTLAAVAGILEASREFSAPSEPSHVLLLNSIAAAVIGGVSLFGGRGKVWAVVLGTLIVGGLDKGLTLMNQPIATEEMVEGAVLLLAVLADALLRRRSFTGLR